MDSTSSGGVTLCSGLAQSSAKLLQGFDVAVVKDRGNHLTLVCIVAGDAYVLLELPFASLCVPCADRAVAVAVGGIFNPVGSEKLCGNSCGILAGNAVHLNFNSDCLVLKVFNLL